MESDSLDDLADAANAAMHRPSLRPRTPHVTKVSPPAGQWLVLGMATGLLLCGCVWGMALMGRSTPERDNIRTEPSIRWATPEEMAQARRERQAFERMSPADQERFLRERDGK